MTRLEALRHLLRMLAIHELERPWETTRKIYVLANYGDFPEWGTCALCYLYETSWARCCSPALVDECPGCPFPDILKAAGCGSYGDFDLYLSTREGIGRVADEVRRLIAEEEYHERWPETKDMMHDICGADNEVASPRQLADHLIARGWRKS